MAEENKNEDVIMNTYVDDLFDERLYKIFKENYGYTEDTVVEAVETWKNKHPEDYKSLKDDFYDEVHGGW